MGQIEIDGMSQNVCEDGSFISASFLRSDQHDDHRHTEPVVGDDRSLPGLQSL